MRRLSGFARFVAAGCVVACLVMDGSAHAETKHKLKVGVYESAPFAFKNDLGNWVGIAADLWTAVANDNGFDFDLVEVNEKDAVGKLAAGELDVIAAGLPVRVESEGLVDFSQPFFASDWAIAVIKKPAVTLFSSLAKIFLSWQLWAVVGGLLLALLFVGLVIWYVEGRENPEDFGSNPAKSMIYGLYWAVAMMTGAGEKAPRSVYGRLIAIVWIFIGLFVTGAFTASVTTMLNVEHLGRKIVSERDLPHVYVAVMRGGCEVTLREMNVKYLLCADVNECFNMLKKGRVDAVVGGEPILEHYAATEFAGKLDIVPMDYEEVFYAIGLRPKSGITEEVNRSILRITSGHGWAETLRLYLEE